MHIYVFVKLGAMLSVLPGQGQIYWMEDAHFQIFHHPSHMSCKKVEEMGLITR